MVSLVIKAKVTFNLLRNTVVTAATIIMIAVIPITAINITLMT